MNIDLNTAVAHSYELSYQLVNQYIACGSQNRYKSIEYAKVFYRFICEDNQETFDARVQSLKKVIGQHCAQLQKKHTTSLSKNIEKLLELSGHIESSLRRSGGTYYSTNTGDTKLENFKAEQIDPEKIVKVAREELENYNSFFNELSNTLNEDQQDADLENIRSKEMEKELYYDEEDGLDGEGLSKNDLDEIEALSMEKMMEKRHIMENISNTPHKKMGIYNAAYLENVNSEIQNKPSQRAPKL